MIQAKDTNGFLVSRIFCVSANAKCGFPLLLVLVQVVGEVQNTPPKKPYRGEIACSPIFFNNNSGSWNKSLRTIV